MSQKTNITLGSGLDPRGQPYVHMTVNDQPPFKLTPEISQALGRLHVLCAVEAEEDAALYHFLAEEFGERYRPGERLQVIENLRAFRQQLRESRLPAEVPTVVETPPGTLPTEEEIAAAREVFKRAGISPVLHCTGG
jgi:hypothetical protein